MSAVSPWRCHIVMDCVACFLEMDSLAQVGFCPSVCWKWH